MNSIERDEWHRIHHKMYIHRISVYQSVTNKIELTIGSIFQYMLLQAGKYTPGFYRQMHCLHVKLLAKSYLSLNSRVHKLPLICYKAYSIHLK